MNEHRQAGFKAPNATMQAWQAEIADACALGPVLDLACGQGQNGLFAAALGCRVEFIDRSQESISAVRQAALDLNLDQSRLTLTVRDLENGHSDLGTACYGAIVVFHYLHRPLLAAIKRALKPGGLLIYETFTREQAQLGRPRNPDFLLEPEELRRAFAEFDELDFFEGQAPSPTRFISRLVARKPKS